MEVIDGCHPENARIKTERMLAAMVTGDDGCGLSSEQSDVICRGEGISPQPMQLTGLTMWSELLGQRSCGGALNLSPAPHTQGRH